MVRRIVAFVMLCSFAAACSGSSTTTPTSLSATTAAPGGDQATTNPPPAPTEPATTTSASEASATSTPATTAAASTTTTAGPVATYAQTIDELLSLGRPIVLAHTAGEDEFPASTLFGFGESVAAGVDMLDLNINLSADDELIVQHDDTVDRNTDGTGAVADLAAAEIAALDAAHWFSTDCADCRELPAEAYLYRGIRTGERPPPAGYDADDFALPTLRQLVERFPDLPLNIEIKGSGDIARRTADVLAVQLDELGRSQATVVASFDDEVVAYFHEVAPDVEVSPGLDALTAYVLEQTPLPDGMRIMQIPPEFTGVQVISPELVARATADDYPIWVWPNDRKLENVAAYRDFLAQGIAGLNINFPAQGVEAVEEFTAGASIAAIPSAGCTSAGGADLAPGETNVALTAAGLDGTYIRHLPPAYDGVTPLPVVVGLHGWSQPNSLLGTQSALPTWGARHRFVAVLPDITRPVPRWDTALDAADAGWFEALLDEIGAQLCIDTARIWVTGMSNGAMMTSTIACLFADRVAAVAPVAGVRLPDGCAPSRPVPMLAFHGTDDQYLAFEGGFGTKVAGLASPDGTGTLGSVTATGPDAQPVPDRMDGWAVLNGCAATPAVASPLADDVTLERWAECDAATSLYVVEGGGHTWPGSAFDQGIGDIVGATTTSVDATATMLDFFRAHPLTA